MSLKINTINNLTKNERQKRNEVEQTILNSDQSKLEPATYLTDTQKIIFNFILENSPHLANVDTLALNALVQSYSDYQNATKHLNKEGLVIDGKKSPYWLIANQSLQSIINLLSTLNLSPKARTKQIMADSENIEDPIKELMKNE